MMAVVIRSFFMALLMCGLVAAQTLGDSARKARSEKSATSPAKGRVYSGEGSIATSVPLSADGQQATSATAVCGPISPEILETITLRFGRDLTPEEEKNAEAAMLKWYDANRHLEKVDPSLIRSGVLIFSDRQNAKINQQADQMVKMAQDAIKENREKITDDKKYREWLLTLRNKFDAGVGGSDEYPATLLQERNRRERNKNGQGLSDPQARRMEAATNLLGICALQSGQAWSKQIQQRVREQLVPYIEDEIAKVK
jgi:hypothetical protein